MVPSPLPSSGIDGQARRQTGKKFVPPSLHMAPFLETVLPAFKWLTVAGFFLGLIESFLYGAYAGLVFVPIYNFLARRWSVPAKP